MERDPVVRAAEHLIGCADRFEKFWTITHPTLDQAVAAVGAAESFTRELLRSREAWAEATGREDEKTSQAVARARIYLAERAMKLNKGGA